MFSKQKINRISDEIAKLLKEQGALSVVNPILNFIRQDHAEIDIRKMIDYAIQLAFESKNEELVKMGISLFGLIDLTSSKDVIGKFLTLALYEDFTLYVAVALSACDNRNELLFEIAQKTNGWGKIHVVERLEPETKKIKDWLLRHGCENTIMDAYLGLICAKKGELISVLRNGNIDEELFEGISAIINAMIDEGPVDGISVYEHAEEAICCEKSDNL